MNLIVSNLKYIVVYGLTFLVLYMGVWPIWNDGGLAMLDLESIDKKAIKRDEIAEALTKSNELKSIGQELDTAYKKLAADPEKLALIEQAIPSDQDTPRLINDLYGISSNNEGMRLNQVRFDKYDPSKEVKGKSGSFRVGFGLKGSYEGIKKTLKDLEGSRRIFNISQMSLQAKEDGLEISITLDAYYLPSTQSKGSSQAADTSASSTNSILKDKTMQAISLLASQNVNFTSIERNIAKLSELQDRTLLVAPQTPSIRPNPFTSKQ